MSSESNSSAPLLHRRAFKKLQFYLILSVLILLTLIIYGLYQNTIQPVNPTLNMKESSSKNSSSFELTVGHLVYLEDLKPLSQSSFSSARRVRLDYSEIAEKSIEESINLKRIGITFRIIVFAWKRRASLKRLLDSLRSSRYHGFTVHLDFHMDGEAHPKVVEFADQYEWPHGRVRVNRHAERIGLERVIKRSFLGFLIILDYYEELAANF